jgi:hypothetical protein
MYITLEHLDTPKSAQRVVEPILDAGLVQVWARKKDVPEWARGDLAYLVQGQKGYGLEIYTDTSGSLMCIEYYIDRQTPAILPDDKRYLREIDAEQGVPIFNLRPWPEPEKEDRYVVYIGERLYWQDDDLVVCINGPLGRLVRKIKFGDHTELVFNVYGQLGAVIFLNITKEERIIIKTAAVSSV